MIHRTIRLALATAVAAGLALAQTPAATQSATQTGTAAKVKTRRANVRHRMIKALNLTDAQKQQAKALFKQTKTANQPLRQQMQQNRQALAAAIKANDAAQIQQLAQVQGNLQGQLAASRAQTMAKFYSTLTPEQKTKADAIQQRIKQHLAQHRNNG